MCWDFIKGWASSNLTSCELACRAGVMFYAFFCAPPLEHVCASYTLRFRLCSPKISQKVTPVLQTSCECDSAGLVSLSSRKFFFTTVFVDTRLWKTKHPQKRFQNFCQSCMLSTDRIEMHQSQPLV